MGAFESGKACRVETIEFDEVQSRFWMNIDLNWSMWDTMKVQSKLIAHLNAVRKEEEIIAIHFPASEMMNMLEVLEAGETYETNNIRLMLS